MASLNLRWVCAPLLFVSSVVFGDEAYIPPPIPYTEVYLPASEFDNNLKACRSGIEFTWGTPTGSPSDCKLESDGLHCLAITTGMWCGSLSENNEFLTNPPPITGPTASDIEAIDDLIRDVRISANQASNASGAVFVHDPSSLDFRVALNEVHRNYTNAIRQLNSISSLIADGVSDLRDYTAYAEGYYQSIAAVSDALLDTNLKVNGLSGGFDADIDRIDSAVQHLNSEIARLESEIENPDFDIQDILDSIDSISGGLSGAYREISSLRVEMYGQINELRSDFNSSHQTINDELTVIRDDIRDTEIRVYDSVFPAIGEVYGHVGNEIGGVYKHVDTEIASLTADIEASNDGIASSIDSQTGEIIGAIDGQTSTLGSKLDGIFSNLFDFSGKFDSFSDYIKGKIGDFEGSLTDGLPSDSDVDSQTGELSSLIDDKDFSRSYSIEFGAKQCPEPISVYMSTLKRDIEISFDLFCQFADIARLFVLASAYIMALMITMGVSRRA